MVSESQAITYGRKPNCVLLSTSDALPLREALKSLAFVGMVRMRPGEGTYVAEGAFSAVEPLKTEQDIAEVWEARMVLETELAALAAERITNDGLRGLEALLLRMEAALDSNRSSYSELDVEFHLAIAASSKNKILNQLLTPIRGILQEWIMKSQELPGLRENAHTQHVKILEAIRERSPEKARRAMQSHLQTFQRAMTLLGKITDGMPVVAQTG